MWKIVKKVVIVLSFLIALSLINVVCFTFMGQDGALRKLSQDKVLSLYEKVSIYQMHCAIWMFGWTIAPNAAMEARLMHQKHKDTIVIHSSFPSFAKPELWKNGVYNPKDPQFEYALALNTDNLEIENTDDYTICTLTVSYTENVHSVGRIPVHTALFKYLQDIGWLHPYKLMYVDLKYE